MDEVQNNMGSSDLQLFDVDEGFWDRAMSRSEWYGYGCVEGLVGTAYLRVRQDEDGPILHIRRPLVPSMEISSR